MQRQILILSNITNLEVFSRMDLFFAYLFFLSAADVI